jgi:hypothetical protein
MVMNNEIKKQGWSQMKDLLDQHMPVEKKKNRFPVWFFIFLPVSFMIGYVVHDQINTLKKHKSPHPVSQYAETQNTKSFSSEPTKKVTSSTAILTDEYKTNTPVSSNEGSKEPFVRSTTNRFVSEQKHSDIPSFSKNHPVSLSQTIDKEKSSVPETIAFESVAAHTEFNDLLPSVELKLSDISYVQSQNTPRPFLPVPAIKVKNKNLRHAVTLSLGLNPNIQNSSTYGLSYDLGYTFGKWSLGASLGYRYSDFSFNKAIDTFQRNYNFQNSLVIANFTLDHMHQIVPGISLSYQISKKIGLTGGVDFPFLLISQKQNSDFLSLDENSLDNGGSPVLEPVNIKVAESSDYIQKSDIQAKMGVSYNWSKNIKLAGVYRRGFVPMNKISFENGYDLKWSQISLDMTYTF